MTTIEEQIQTEMRNAFFNLIDDNINSKTPDYDWITRLYEEIKIKLLSFLPNKNGKIYKQLELDFDVDLFKQMIENDVFNQESMIKLVNNTFHWILKLEAPVRDKDTNEAKNRVFNSAPEKIISTYLKEVHRCIEQIETDIIEFQKKS
jgi:hypothetical protein